MWHKLGIVEKDFFCALVAADQNLADEVLLHGCPCGGRLHRSDFPRKPRGVPEEWDRAFSRRISFCCAREGCRRRQTPPSVRFSWRRVYVAAVVLVCSAEWVTARVAAVPRRTVRRWRRFWRSDFVAASFWQAARARLVPPVADDEMPAALLARFVGPRANALVSALSFLSPTTTKSAAGLMAK